ncbi:MAG: hypothetical protein IPJ65_12720 [Archangiaceae bacterium]|nr:hypothetical protein [Archangiaceae bacterium]
MTLELDDEELTDVREALRLHLAGLFRDLAKADRRRFIETMRARLDRLEALYSRLDRAAVTGPISATH